MKKAVIAVICLLVLVSAVFMFEGSITGNLIKLPFLKNLAVKNNVQPSNALPTNQPPSEDNMVLKEGSAFNRKDAGKYYAKQAFVVSDKDWHNVLSLVPVSLWHESGELKKYPVLIYHEEDNGFDADSVVTFLKQYGSKKVVLVGDTPEELDNILIADGYTYLLEAEVAPLTPPLSPLTGRVIADIPPVRREELTAPIRGIDLTPNWLTRISPDDYAKYWSSYSNVVICEDNYQLGLLASVYASYLNAPLFFEGRVPSDVNLARKRIVTVGRTSYAGAETYNLAQLEQKLARDYPTDKIILVNYNDLSIKETRPLNSESLTWISRTPINEIYSKTSLSAPFLAAAKQEFLLTTNNMETNAVKAVMEGKIAGYGLNPKYLTIMASPAAIQMDERPAGRIYYSEVDNHIYGDLNVMGVVDGMQDLAVGRIFSITPSDVSSYIAKDILIEYFRADKSFASLWPAAIVNLKGDGKTTDRILSNGGFRDSSIYTDEDATFIDAERDLKDKSYIAYLDHGTTNGWSGGIQTDNLISYNTQMDPAIVFSVACETCAYSLTTDPGKLFCSNMLRHGAIAHIGAVDGTSNDFKSSTIIANELLEGKNIGMAMLKYKQAFEAYKRMKGETKMLASPSSREELPYEHLYVLLGDPTMKLVGATRGTEDVSITDTGTSNKIVTIRINQPDSTYLITCDRERGAECPAGEFTFYEPPVSKSYLSGTRQMEDRLNPGFNPIFEDMIYFETSGFTDIRSAKVKIRYSDGTSENYNLEKHGNLFYDCAGTCLSTTEDHAVQLYDLNTGGDNHRIIMRVYKRGLGVGKILPSYNYELELETRRAV